MDHQARKITKIAREAERLLSLTMRGEGVGTAEIDCIHAVRHNPGITQTELSAKLNADKPAIARRIANLEKKGYLRREPNPEDGRSQLLFATDKAESLRGGKVETESEFYEYLMEGLDEETQKSFLAALDVIYRRSKTESRAGFPNLLKRLEEKKNETEKQ